MTGRVTSIVVRKAWDQTRSIRREYMMFTSNMECLRFVLNPKTHLDIQSEFWDELHDRSAVSSEFHPLSWRPAPGLPADMMLGIKVDTDKKVPEGEVELRAVLARSWEAV